MQRNKQVAMGRKKFNMDPKKVLWDGEQGWLPVSGGVHGSPTSQSRFPGLGQSQQPGQGQPQTPKCLSFTSAGHPVPDRERPAEEHVRGHRSVPV